jgi:hypothetical protein
MNPIQINGTEVHVNPLFTVGAAMLLIGLSVIAVLLITNWGRS